MAAIFKSALLVVVPAWALLLLALPEEALPLEAPPP
jgi:hypothetical protein